jgi:hypothetical protein
MPIPYAYARLFLAMAIALPVHAGEFRNEYDVTVYVSDLETAKTRIDAFVNECESGARKGQVRTDGGAEPGRSEPEPFRVESRSESRNSLYLTLSLSGADLAKLNALLSKLGHVGSREMKSVDNADRLEQDSMELAFLREKKIAYKNQLAAPDSSPDKSGTRRIMEEIHATDLSIFKLEKAMAKLRDIRSGASVRLRVEEENTSPRGTSFAFVNMPGVEYGLLRIENPKPGFSAGIYQGASIKYLFTRGKSFGMIGVYHAFDDGEGADSAAVSELFFLSLGQDFYSRHFGRGANRFLNLYTGYTAGGAFLSGDAFSRWSWHLNPYLGLELFKNKNILIDNKVGYFIPLRYTRKLRGLSYGASFNFAF